jgi:hypothetical protein
MARTKASEGESRSSIFTRYFTKRPDLLRESNFDAVAEMYKQEFPDRDFEDRDRQIAANIKSKLRREFKIGRRRRKRGRPAKAAAAGAAAGANTAPRAGRPASSLPMLEDHIDECLMLAKRLDREGLDDVIKHLRRARNIVVVKLGEQ